MMYTGYGAIELMGHRSFTGYMQPIDFSGAVFIELSIALPDGYIHTAIYAPAAVYSINPLPEEAITDLHRAHNERMLGSLGMLTPAEHARWEERRTRDREALRRRYLEDPAEDEAEGRDDWEPEG